MLFIFLPLLLTVSYILAVRVENIAEVFPAFSCHNWAASCVEIHQKFFEMCFASISSPASPLLNLFCFHFSETSRFIFYFIKILPVKSTRRFYYWIVINKCDFDMKKRHFSFTSNFYKKFFMACRWKRERESIFLLFFCLVYFFFFLTKVTFGVQFCHKVESNFNDRERKKRFFILYMHVAAMFPFRSILFGAKKWRYIYRRICENIEIFGHEWSLEGLMVDILVSNIDRFCGRDLRSGFHKVRVKKVLRKAYILAFSVC